MLNTSKSSQPLVSIIIPTYNRPDYLKQAVRSAVNQTYKNIEIIVSDNCSDKNPQQIVESFQDSRIKFIRNSHNIGMCANIINPVKIACGKYIAFLLDDDMWKDDFLEKLIEPLELDDNLAAAYCDFYVVNQAGKVNLEATEKSAIHAQRNLLNEETYQPFYEIGLVRKSLSSTIGAVIRKDAVNWSAIPIEVGGYLDIYINYLIGSAGKGIYYSPQKLAFYREHEGTDTQTDTPQARIRKAKYQIFSYQEFLKDPALSDYHPHFQKRCIQANQVLGVSLLQTAEYNQARSHLWQVIKHNKRSVRALSALALSWAPPLLTNFLLAKSWWF